MRKLELSGAFSCSEMKPSYVEGETSQMTHVDESSSTLSDERQRSREGVKNKDGKADEAVDWSHPSC